MPPDMDSDPRHTAIGHNYAIQTSLSDYLKIKFVVANKKLLLLYICSRKHSLQELVDIYMETPYSG